MLSDLKLHYKARAIKTVWYLQKKEKKQTHRSMEQNREPRYTNPDIYGYLIYDEGIKKLQGEESLSNKWC